MKAGVKAIYKKPLTGELKGDVTVVLKKLKRQFLRRLKVQLSATGFSNRAKRAFSQAMKVEVKKNAILLTVLHPAWRPMIEGQKREQMIWLRKAKTPIPIITESGKLIFRTASARSMNNGKWIHPGRRPSNFVEMARRETRAWAKKALPELLRREIAKTLSGK